MDTQTKDSLKGMVALIAAGILCVGSSSTWAAMVTGDVGTTLPLPGPSLFTSGAPTNKVTASVAKRLSSRITREFGVTPPLGAVENAVAERQALLSKNVNVQLQVNGPSPDTQSGSALAWNVSVAAHPEWIVFSATSSTASFALSAQAVKNDLSASLPLGLPAVVDGFADNGVKDSYGVTRLSVSTHPQAGYEFNPQAGADAVLAAFTQGKETVSMPIVYRDGRLSLGSGTQLTLLATGLSDYRTSPWGRMANINKAIHERIDTAVVPQGVNFSFNSLLGGPISHSNGWFDSLIIVNGSSLEPAPGGGICQTATTVYRAAILAGLPVIKRAPHSLYVHYYELFGLGLDATVFPGSQDLVFQNNTPGNIVILATTQGTNVTVQFYGVQDGRSVAMDGPYVGPGYDQVFGRTLKSNEIGWMQTIKLGDGSVEHHPIISAYTKMPHTAAEHIATTPQAQPVAQSKPANLALR